MYINQTLKHKITELTKKNRDKKIVIWGAGSHGKLVAKVLDELEVNFEFFVDSNITKQGNQFSGKLVYSPDILKNKADAFYVLVVMTYRYNEVDIYLDAFGFKEELHYFNFSPIKKVIDKIESYSDRFNNSIIGVPDASKSKVVFQGKNNKVVFEEGVRLLNCSIEFYCNYGYCYIGKGSSYKGTIHIGEGCKVIIGERLTITQNCLISTAESTEVRIGNDCMFASNNQIRSHDSHPIFDVSSGERINVGRSVHIDDHVWLSYASIVLSGARIGTGSIIGHSSIVKSTIPNNCIAVGSPARVIKRNIAWSKSDLLKTSSYFSNSDYNIDRRYWFETKDR